MRLSRVARGGMAALLAALAGAGLCIGCDSGSGTGKPSPTAPSPAATPPAPAPSPPAAEPAPAPSEPAPAEPTSAGTEPAPAASQARSVAVARGAELYGVYCATCHGKTGDGDGPAAAGLDPKPTRHSDGNLMNGLSDAYLEKVIREGGAAVGKSPMMAAWGGSLTDAQIADVVAFIRTLATPPYKP